MKIFLVWNSEPKALNLISKLKQSGHEIVYWTGRGGLKAGEDLPGTILHDHWDAWVGIPPKELADLEFDPPDEELIKKLSGVESIILTMMNKHFEGRRVDERKHFYYNNLRYWHGVLNKIKPDALLIDTPPHPDYCYLLYELARLLKIKTLMFEYIWLAGRMIWYNDMWEGSRKLLAESARNQDKTFSLEDLSEDLRLYYKFHTAEGNDTTPSYYQELLKSDNLKGKIILKIKIILKSLRDFTIFKKVFSYFKKLLINNPQKEYRRFYNPHPDLSKKFIYLPLQYQPECTTSPMGGIFVNQILMIQTLAAALPEGWLIYVKEHPAQWIKFGLNYTDYRYPGYYKQIAGIKNVRLISIETDTFSLIKNSQAVATVTGTAGWEGILRYKPALVFGCAWYKYCPGVFKVNSAATCRLALKEIVNGYQVSRQSIINYLKALEISSIHGFAENDFNRNKKITEPDCVDNILKVIINELK